jgi:hypothetical protein
MENLVQQFFSYDLIKVGWATFEGILAFTHFCVLFGLRNSDLNYLRANQIYFFEDGMSHLVSVLYYSLSHVGIFPYLNWRLMLLVHISVWLNLILNPPHTDKKRLYKVYHWSCSECLEDRFNFANYGLQIVGTALDVMAHSCGFYFMFLQLDYNMKIICLLISCAVGLYFLIVEKNFKTYTHLMPRPLRKIFDKQTAK